MIAHIQYRRGLPATEGCYSAWRALEDRGWEIRPFEHIDEVATDPEQPVIGGVPNVVAALDQLGVVPPDVDYPAALRPFLLDPALETTTMGWARHARDRWPIFVKPTTGRKEFTGFVLQRTDDLLRVTSVDDELPVFVGRPVDLRTKVEWRAFVIDGEVRDIRPYTGRADGDAPSLTFVQMLANQWHSAPAGCSIDVVNIGDRVGPDWRVVECNDGYSLGSFGLFPSSYAELLVKRWAELVGIGELWYA